MVVVVVVVVVIVVVEEDEEEEEQEQEEEEEEEEEECSLYSPYLHFIQPYYQPINTRASINCQYYTSS